MRRFFITFILFILCFSLIGQDFCLAFGKTDYDKLYEDMPILDFMYETGVDMEEPDDYNGYFISPYILVRMPVRLRNQKILLKPGYYLVKPDKKNGYNIAVFKQNGKVSAVVPVYKKYITNPTDIFPEPPKKKNKWYVKPFVTAGNIVKWPFKKIFRQRAPEIPPRAKAEFELVDNEKYYILSLFVENHLYKMLFKLEQ